MNLILLPNIVAALLVLSLAVTVIVRRPPAALGPIMLLFQGFVLLYLLGDAITLVSRDMYWEQLGIGVLYSGSLPGAFCCWLMAIRYAEAQGQPFVWARGPWLWVPFAITALGVAAVLTNPWHGQFVQPVIGDHNQHLWMWWVATPFAHALVWATILLYAALAFRASERRVRNNALIMASGLMISIFVNFISYTPPLLVPVDLTAAGLAAANLLFLLGTYRTRLFALLPVALPKLVEYATDGLVLVDPRGRWLYANPAGQTMLGGQENADALELMHECLDDPMRGAPDRDALAAQLLNPARGTAEIGPYRLPDGRWVHVTSGGIPDRRGDILAFALRLGDITALREATARLQAEEQRHRAQERMERDRRLHGLGLVAGGIAHDFNNLLSIIVGNAQLATQSLDSPEQTRHHLDRIRHAGDFAVELTEQMLTTAGKRSAELSPLDLTDLVAGMEDLLGASIPAKCQIVTRLETRPTEIMGEATQLRQVVMNLVRNAADAQRSRGGRIWLQTGLAHFDPQELDGVLSIIDTTPGEFVYLEVADDGPGMDEAVRERVFEPFFTTRPSGRGLGLAAVNGIAHAHGAIVTLDTSPGEGCCFRLYFRAAAETRAAAPRARPAAAHGAILVVEDEPAILELTCAYLGRGGYEVIAAASGEEAIQCVIEDAGPLAAVVLDVGLPGLDGPATVAKLRQHRPGLPVVLVSGFGDEISRERFHGEPHATRFLAKPYDPEALIAAVREAMADASPDAEALR